MTPTSTSCVLLTSAGADWRRGIRVDSTNSLWKMAPTSGKSDTVVGVVTRRPPRITDYCFRLGHRRRAIRPVRHSQHQPCSHQRNQQSENNHDPVAPRDRFVIHLGPSPFLPHPYLVTVFAENGMPAMMTTLRPFFHCCAAVSARSQVSDSPVSISHSSRFTRRVQPGIVLVVIPFFHE